MAQTSAMHRTDPARARTAFARRGLAVLLAAILAGPALGPPALAMGGGAAPPTAEPAAPPRPPGYDAGLAAVQAQDWQGALGHFTQARAADPANADVENYLGFVNRKLGQYDAAFTHYYRALELKPEHLGANEYLGETFIAVGDLAKAEMQLARLQALCGTACAEYEELKARLAEAKARQGATPALTPAG
ncbi:tetratricopeptide repeat protein [Zavarzinia sp. CC-PAN008]|uniref:tetratricopeptide repeat protein n=1 Tax=Zavarzinia sp. CC-PAN008 TaxID=3243332 RepID=UPI003F74A40C